MAKRRRETKKKSNNGIWIGTGVSACVVVLIAIALYFKFQPGPPDSPSGAITETNLAKQNLKTSDLPDLGKAPGGSGSFGQLLAEIAGAKNVMRSGGFEQEKKTKAREITQALHGAAAGQLADGFLDAKIPPKRFESPDLKQDLQVLGSAVRMQVDAHLEDVEFDAARAIAASYLKLGQQAFEKNTRLKSRQRGLAMMRSALSTMGRINRARYDDGAIGEDELRAANDQIMDWNNAIKDVEDVWNSKLKVIESVNQAERIPNIADLVTVANEDKDATFRVFAARRLGYAL
ncbi:MAG: hypothetical protein ACPGYV_02865, partial [Phycisphaeraceae bacterium]